MNSDFGAGLFGTGSAMRLVSVLTDDLVQGRSLLALLPAGVSCERMRATLGGELRQRDCDVRTLYVDETPSGLPDHSYFAESLGVRWPAAETQRTVENLLRCDGMPEVILCEGLERLGYEQVSVWMKLLTRWAEAAQGLERPPALCIIAPAALVLEHVPPTNVRLAVRWWWGVPSLLELRLLCQDRLGQASPMCGGDTWREHMIPAISGCDVWLAADLWGPICSEEEAVYDALGAHAATRGWSAGVLSEWGAQTFIRGSQARNTYPRRPEKPFARLWAEGAAHYTREHGLELQTAALLTLGQHEAVRHRLWRGQASLLLPMVDGLRLQLCSRLTEIYGRRWSWRWIPPVKEKEYNAVIESDYGCELGHLAHLLRACPQLRNHDGWVPLAVLARDLRNDLAHYKPVSYARFEEFWLELYGTGESLV